MKMCIADRISIPVDAIFSNLHACGTVETVAAAAGFSIQIYADFAGYSAIAIGAARMMGIGLTENFNTPYFAESIGDFWHRWHVSLSSWFRDYVYIPLGGNRKGKARKHLNTMITFLVSGLWHGSSWSYVLWGGIHGFYLVMGEVLKPLRERVLKLMNVNRETFSFRFGRRLITCLLAGFAWIFFRAHSIGNGIYFVKRMFTHYNPWALFDESLFRWGLDRREMGILFFCLLILLAVSILRQVRKTDIGSFLLTQNLYFRWAAFLLLLTAVVVWGEYGVDFDSAQFIYFNF